MVAYQNALWDDDKPVEGV